MKQNEWRSGSFCYFIYETVLFHQFLSPLLHFWLALARLRVVEYPLSTKFKKRKFVSKVLLGLHFGVLTESVGTTLSTTFFPQNIGTNLCSPFVDAGQTTAISVINTSLLCILNLGATIGSSICHVLLVIKLKKSKKEIKEALSQKQSNRSLFLQVSILTVSYFLCWIPCAIIYVALAFVRKYPQQLLFFTTMLIAPLNSVVFSSFFSMSTARKYFLQKFFGWRLKNDQGNLVSRYLV